MCWCVLFEKIEYYDYIINDLWTQKTTTTKTAFILKKKEEYTHSIRPHIHVVKGAAIHVRVGWTFIETTTEIVLHALQVSKPSKC